MEPEKSPVLMSVAAAVADGCHVDWEGLLAAEPAVAEGLQRLRLFEGIIAAHRDVSGRSQSPPPPSEPR